MTSVMPTYSWKGMTTRKQRTREEMLALFEQAKRDAAITMLGKYNRTLTQQPLTVEWVASGPAPAWSDDDTIYLNTARVSIDDLDDVAVMLGLNLHEDFHRMFSPRLYSEFMQQVREEGLFNIWNMAEDQRIEMLGRVRWYNVENKLLRLMRRYIVTDPSKQLHPLIHGRKYLPLAVRQHYRDLWQDEHGTANEIAALLDEYLTITHPRDDDRALEILRELLAVFPNPPQTGGCGRGPDGQDGGYPMTPEEIEDLSDKAAGKLDDEETEAREPNDTDSDGQNEGSDEIDDDADGEGGESGDTDGDEDGGTGSGDSDADQQGQDGDGEGDSTGGGDSTDSTSGDGEGEGASTTSQKGDGAGRPKHDSDDRSASSTGNGQGAGPSVLEEFDQAMDQAKSEGKDRDLESYLEEILDAAAEFDPDNPMEPVSPEARQLSEAIRDSLTAIAERARSGTLRRQSRGRLNIRRWITQEDPSSAFDRWHPEAKDATDIETVVILDASGSMAREMANVNQAAWAIKTAADSIPGPRTTVLWFHSPGWCQIPDEETWGYVYGPDHRMSRSKYVNIEATNGTRPRPALEEASRIFAESTKVSKVLIILTDGQWSDQEQEAQFIRENFPGVIRHIVGYGYRISYDPGETHGAHVGVTVSNMRDFATYVEQTLVQDILSRIDEAHF